MKIRTLLRALSAQIVAAMLLLAGCQSSPLADPAKENANPGAAGVADEIRRVADEALGKQAEIVLRGDLARNGLEQVLAVNRFARDSRSDAVPQNSQVIFVTQAVILEKSNGKWSEILRCDEHLKNPNGYLGGSPEARVTGWRLEYRTDARQGLELKFTPASSEAGEEGTGTGEPVGHTVDVRWNARAKRYQSLDSSHEGYLSEAPTIETPHSILR